MIDQHNLLEKKVATENAKGNIGLIADVGKDWINTVKNWMAPPPVTNNCPDEGPIRSANYGWHAGGSTRRAATVAGGTVWQPIGRCHNMAHADYSQMVRLVRREVKVCCPDFPVWPMNRCKVMDIAALAGDPKLAHLVSHEGQMEAMRHPAVLRSCEPGVRCPTTIMSGMQVRSLSCPLHCADLPPAEPDPTTKPAPPPDPSDPYEPPPVDGVAQVGAGGYVTAAALAAGAFAGAWWFTTRYL